MQNGKYMSKKQAAASLSLSERTIDRLRAEGELDDSYRPRGRLVRVTCASVERYERHRAQRDDAATADSFAIPTLDALRVEKARLRAADGAGEEAA